MVVPFRVQRKGRTTRKMLAGLDGRVVWAVPGNPVVHFCDRPLSYRKYCLYMLMCMVCNKSLVASVFGLSQRACQCRAELVVCARHNDFAAVAIGMSNGVDDAQLALCRRTPVETGSENKRWLGIVE